MKRALILSCLLLAPTAFAQTMEYGRAGAGTIDMTTKQPQRFFGSLSLSSTFGTGGTFGGTALKDKVWFFASADHASKSSLLRTSTTNTNFNVALPKDFLSLHTTSVLSPSSFVTIDVSQSRH